MNTRNIPLIATMQQQWQALSLRERRSLAAGGLVVAAVVGYFLIWAPAAGWAAEQRQRLADASTTAAVVAAGHARLKAADTSRPGTEHTAAEQALPVGLSSGSAMQQAQQIAARHDIAASIRRREPVGEDGLMIRFDQVPFPALSRWISAMNARQFDVTEAELRPETPDAPQGLVNARLTLSRTAE